MMVFYKSISCYMSGSNLFGQWSWCDTTKNDYCNITESMQNGKTFLERPEILQINWSYNLLKIDDNFYVSGSWYGKDNQFAKVPIPEGNNIKDLLIVGNDYKILVVSKNNNTVWEIDLKKENEFKKRTGNIEELVENVEKRKRIEMVISKVVLVNDCCLYLTATGNVFSGMVNPKYVDTSHCRGKVCDIKCGFEHYVLLTDEGFVYTWGNGRRLQLGHDDISNLEVPTEVEALAGIKIIRIACGGWHSFALSESGDLYTWGWNDTGQLGIKYEEDKLESLPAPTLVDLYDSHGEQLFLNVKDIACGSRHSALLLEDNSLWTTGYNKYGQLGFSEKDYSKISHFKKAFECDANGRLMCGPWTTVVVME